MGATATANSNNYPSNPMTLIHSNSASTFHHDADILWEKRVSLDSEFGNENVDRGQRRARATTSAATNC